MTTLTYGVRAVLVLAGLLALPGFLFLLVAMPVGLLLLAPSALLALAAARRVA